MKKRTARNKIIWTDQEINFLKENFLQLTSYELASQLGKSRTIVRMKYKELGLQKIKMEYWSEEMIQYLKNNFQKTGNVELASIFQEKFPKEKPWTKNHINKKLTQLKLKRTTEEVIEIVKQNTTPGGPCFTILRNSSSLNMHDSWIVQKMAWRNPSLQKELLNHPQLIAVKRQQILLKRELINQKNEGL